MDLKNIYREIVNEHNLHPEHKCEIDHATHTKQGVNPTCGDDITLSIEVDDNGIITNAGFSGAGCAVSQASTDIMLDLVVGKSKEEAHQLIEMFMKMVHGELSEEEMDDLDEAVALKDIAHMPARAKCATLAWHTLDTMLE